MGKRTFRDLCERETPDGIYLSTWLDEGMVYIAIAFITLAIPVSEFEEVVKFLKDTEAVLKTVVETPKDIITSGKIN